MIFLLLCLFVSLIFLQMQLEIAPFLNKVSEMHNLKLFNFLASQKKIYSYLFQITMMLSPGQKKHN